MEYTAKNLSKFDEEELIEEVMENYILVVEDTYGGFLNNKEGRRRECFYKLKFFITKSINQALAEERARVIKKIQELTGEMRTSETDKILASLKDINQK